MSLAIEVTDLRKVFTDRRAGDIVAVDGASFSVAEGEFFGILGPNGAGKTTTLEIIEGLQTPDSGGVKVLGQSPWPHDPKLMRRFGVQLQASSFFPFLKVGEQINAFAELYGVGGEQAAATLERVGLTDKAKTLTSKLSGGQAQRLSIACALVHDPELLFLDEPSGPLDPQARRNLWDVLRDINAEGRTVVLTTHYMEEAEALCDRVAIMDSGRILDVDSPASLARALDAPTRITVAAGQLSGEQRQQLANAGDELSGRNGAEIISTRDPKRVLTQLANWEALEDLSVHTANLEDVFLALTGREWRE
ncbi:ABC transporter ATP-binding protein [Natronoglycomyces albus]|uniref:ABC transporter ATP-binding protein n=1 Tax=Natronoglycomyces albus TaxID=2811108 RepID=A0A895XLX9_9ACTN|nr:ABC transporter ATP-binding protein [Natronoglycomyces albus]QSB04419.1 ABC transporter ATP-binding protein [Natronoglycomyces albus]